MVNLVLLDSKVLLESRDLPGRKDLKDTEVLSVCKVCLVPLVLLEREDHQVRMGRTESPAPRAQEVHLDWTELLVQWVILDLLGPGECRARRAREVHQESSDPPVLQVHLESLLVLTWPPSPQ